MLWLWTVAADSIARPASKTRRRLNGASVLARGKRKELECKDMKHGLMGGDESYFACVGADCRVVNPFLTPVGAPAKGF
jgi:hypothetical protein